MKSAKTLRFISILLLVCFTMSSCKFYTVKSYKDQPVSTSETLSSGNIKKKYKKKTPKYFLHVGDQYWQLEGVSLTDSLLMAKYQLPVDSLYKHYYERAITERKVTASSKHEAYTNQIHLFADQFKQGTDGGILVSMNDITKIDLMESNGLSTVIIITLVTAAATAAVLAITLALLCNCPHAYTFDGEQYHYNNALFTGATAPALERSDYKELPDYFPDSDSYQLMIKNEQNEIQNTNLLELMVVEHDKNTRVFPDQKGEIYSIDELTAPLKVVADNGTDLQHLLGYEDDLGYDFDNRATEDFAHVYATFETPENKEDAKLIVKAMNSKWGGFVYNQFSQLFGNKFDEWTEKSYKRSAEEIHAYRKSAGIPLLVSIKVGDEWVDVEMIDLVSDVNYNSLVVKIDPKYLTEDTFEVRLKSGFKFWNVDHISLDDSAPQAFSVQHLQPTSAITNGTTDETNALANDDELYMEHHVNGDSAVVLFNGLKTNESLRRTLFLKSKGYYLVLDEFEGKPNRKELAKFKKEGELSRYSQQLYDQYKERYALIKK